MSNSTVAGLPALDQENLPSAEDGPAWPADAALNLAWQADLMPESPPSAKATLTSLPYRLAARRIILPWILQGVEPSGEGLEIGAGVGALTAQLLAQYPRFRMVATDSDAEQVAMAEQVLSSFGRRASVQRADAVTLPFPDGRFDLVLSAAMLHQVIEWDKALAEAVRVLRPGGKLVGYDMSDTAAGRLISMGERPGTSLLRPGQLDTALSRLGLTDLQTRTALAGTVMRFSARKPLELT
jgi:ubiquinone/menaquinone biosynthesis C-methylase UbiE